MESIHSKNKLPNCYNRKDNFNIIIYGFTQVNDNSITWTKSRKRISRGFPLCSMHGIHFSSRWSIPFHCVIAQIAGIWYNWFGLSAKSFAYETFLMPSCRVVFSLCSRLHLQRRSWQRLRHKFPSIFRINIHLKLYKVIFVEPRTTVDRPAIRPPVCPSSHPFIRCHLFSDNRYLFKRWFLLCVCVCVCPTSNSFRRVSLSPNCRAYQSY